MNKKSATKKKRNIPRDESPPREDGRTVVTLLLGSVSSGIPVVALVAVLLQGCAVPASNSQYFAMDPAQGEANRANIRRVQQEDRDADNIERMRQARAIEVATRHAPRVINQSSTSQQTQVIVDP